MKINRSVRCFIFVLLTASAANAAVVEPHGANSAALEAALEQVRPGDTLHLPAGVYVLERTLRLASGVHLAGDGPDKTILQPNFTEKPAPMIDLAGTQGIELSGFTLNARMSPNVSEAIGASNASRLLIHHLAIRDLAQGDYFGPHGIYFGATVTDSLIEDCDFENIGVGAKYGGAIRFSHGSSRNAAIGNTIENTGRGGIFGDDDSTDLLIRDNKISGSGGEGLGIEVWHNCARSVIEDNRIDHWLSIDGSDFTAVRRNIVSDKSGTYKYCGLELVNANNCVLTDNVVDGGQQIGLSVSGKEAKNNNLFAHDVFSHSASWGAQLQGEQGGFDRNYFYHCGIFESGKAEHPPLYPHDAGHGLRCNGDVRHLTVEACEISRNAGHAIQLLGAGPQCDGFDFIDCYIHDNRGDSIVGDARAKQITWRNCRIVAAGGDQAMPTHSPSAGEIAIQLPADGATGQPVAGKIIGNASQKIEQTLWDFSDGPASNEPAPTHVYQRPGQYRVTLIAWDVNGHGSRAEKTIEIAQTSPARSGRSGK